MGKKTKIGKQRRDKFYRLAKEAGYRSRAAFKLIQLNKRFEFLQNARACVDLCAAPGGWMQVAAANMPVSSLVIGVDLVPIRAVRNCISLQGDITTEKTRQDIKKELHQWEADCVLHDGAPNVGLNWIHDAFNQNCLVLSALKLTTQILKKGGTFVTKVFRSNDYSCLITTFEKLFKKVHVWKPAASRLESAEIFVVCEKYLKPPKVAPELLDHKKVFAEPDGCKPEDKRTNPQLLLLNNMKQRKTKADGYDGDSLTVYKTIDATTFIQASQYLEVLTGANKIILDQDKWKESPATTEEILEYLEDLKVCGPRALRALLKWRKAMRAILDKEAKELEEEEAEKRGPEEEEVLDEDEIEEREMAEIDAMIAKASDEEKAALKKKKKMMLKSKAKIIKRKQLRMIIDGDVPDHVEDLEIFSLKKIRRARELSQIVDGDVQAPDLSYGEGGLVEDDEEGLGDGEWETREGKNDSDDSDDEDKIHSDDESDNELIQTEQTISGMSKQDKKDTRTHKWFQQNNIADLISSDEEDDDLNVVEKIMKKQKKSDDRYENTVTFDDDDDEGFSKKKNRKNHKNDGFDEKDSDDEEAEDSDEEAEEQSDDDEDAEEIEEKATSSAGKAGNSTATSSSKKSEKKKESKAKNTEDKEKNKKSAFEAEMDWEDAEVEDEDRRTTKREAEKTILGEDLAPKAKKRRLTPEQLAMAEQLIYSSKSARELEEWGWNRYTNNDEGLPDWFVEDEKKHYKKELPVTKAQVAEYRARLKELNARPCKKVAEAKARKQRKTMLKMQRAKKKAENVLENDNLEHSEKIREMKKIYSQAAKKEHKKAELVVMTKGKKGKFSRPNGRYKLVDSRMKKDLRAQKAKEKTKSRGKKGKGGSSKPKVPANGRTKGGRGRR